MNKTFATIAVTITSGAAQRGAMMNIKKSMFGLASGCAMILTAQPASAATLMNWTLSANLGGTATAQDGVVTTIKNTLTLTGTFWTSLNTDPITKFDPQQSDGAFLKVASAKLSGFDGVMIGLDTTAGAPTQEQFANQFQSQITSDAADNLRVLLLDSALSGRVGAGVVDGAAFQTSYLKGDGKLSLSFLGSPGGFFPTVMSFDVDQSQSALDRLLTGGTGNAVLTNGQISPFTVYNTYDDCLYIKCISTDNSPVNSYYRIDADVLKFARFTVSAIKQPAVEQPPVEPVASVPEPSTWAMMIVGFGLVGGVARRRDLGHRRLAAG